MNNILEIILVTLLPFLELRASIPYGIIKLNMPWLTVFIIAVISNIILGIIVFYLLEHIIKYATKIKIIDNYYQKYLTKTQKKIEKGVEKYGEWAIAIFIGIPLPMSGVYSGALAAYIIGLSYKKFILATIIGVLIAATAVTIITLSGATAFNIFLKHY
jgi:uncharacterized membrane protein